MKVQLYIFDKTLSYLDVSHTATSISVHEAIGTWFISPPHKEGEQRKEI